MSDERSARLTREQLAAADWESLMLQPAFKRTLYTILQSASILHGAYGTDGRHLPFAEGRRSLGFDILRTAERYAGPEALLLILSEEMKTQKEAPHANRKRSDYQRQRNAELGGPDGSSPGIDPGEGLVFLDYSTDGG